MASIGEMYNHVENHANLPPMGETLFYSRSLIADIVVVSEAPT